MRIHESGENYLETILILSKKNGSVRSIDIANELDFSKPSFSIAMKNLRENDYLKVDSDGFITLTDKGKEIAKSMYERHLLLSKWLMNMGVAKEIAEKDACRMEHILSSESFEAIRKYCSNMNFEKKDKNA